jgi:hypothetical protein
VKPVGVATNILGVRAPAGTQARNVAVRRTDGMLGAVSDPPREPTGGMSVRGAAFLGIGAMIGAGIFALLGEAGAVAGSAVWLSFLLAGIVATLLGYTVAGVPAAPAATASRP